MEILPINSVPHVCDLVVNYFVMETCKAQLMIN